MKNVINMKYAKIFLISLLLLVLFSTCVVCASEDVSNYNLTVENQNSDLTGNCDEQIIETADFADEETLHASVTVSGKTFKDIENAIDGASSGDTIKLTGTYTGGGSPIYVDKTVTIQGPSATNKATLDAKGLSGIILTGNAKVTLKNIIFKNSNGDMVILDNGATIQNCNFQDSKNKAISYQGASDSNGLTVKNCIFDNNEAGIYFDAKKLIVEKSTFTNNKGSSIALNSWGTVDFLIKDSKFENNHADDGAAIFAYLSQGRGDINNCIFNNNNVEGYGGAISFKGNDEFEFNILNSNFTLNAAKTDSALSINKGHGSIKNSIFINNNAADELKSIGSVFNKFVLENNTVKANENINENLKLEFLKNPSFYGDICQVKFTKDGKALSNKKIIANAYNSKSLDKVTFNFVTDSNGMGRFSFSAPTVYMDVGVWDIQFTADSGNTKTVCSLIDLNIKKLSANLVLNGFSTTYGSGKTYSLKLLNKDNNAPAGNVCLYVTIYKNGYYLKNYRIKTDLNGIANVKISDLPAANYKITVSSDEVSSIMDLTEKSASIKINKAPTKIKAPKVKNKYKKSKYFKITVKAYNKPLKKVKIKVKVYTGKKSKTYVIKTDKKGVAKLNTKKLSRGKHKVVISSGNSNYKISAKSKITIK